MTEQPVAAAVGVDHVVIVTSASRELRRSLGVVAWSVLEDVALDARWDGTKHVAATNVRRIADQLGISKDTAARAVACLVAAGLVSRLPASRSADGTFAPGGYTLEVELLDAVVRLVAPPQRESGTPAIARPRGRRAKVSAPPARRGQEALFDLEQAMTS